MIGAAQGWPFTVHYEWRDDAACPPTKCGFGILTKDGQPTSSYNSIAKSLQELRGYSIVGRIPAGEHWLLVFSHPTAGRKLVGWSPGGAGHVRIRGHKGTVELDLGTSPVYKDLPADF